MMPYLVSYEQTRSLSRRWILSRVAKTRRPERSWTQFCVACFKEDQTPYMRRIWRFAFLTVCPKHKILLRDVCPYCAKPFNYASYEIGRPIADYVVPVSTCGNCGKDARDCNEASPGVSRGICSYEKALINAVRRGWTRVNTAGWVYSQRVLDVIFLLIGQLRASEALQRLAALDGFGSTPIPEGRFEAWPLAARHCGMLWIEALLRDWPLRFLQRCKEAQIRSWTLCSRRDPVPMWFHHVVNEHLYRPWYTPTIEEVASVRSLITRAGLSDVHYTRRRLLGRWHPHRQKPSSAERLPTQLQLFECTRSIGEWRLRGELAVRLITALRSPIIRLVMVMHPPWVDGCSPDVPGSDRVQILDHALNTTSADSNQGCLVPKRRDPSVHQPSHGGVAAFEGLAGEG